MAMTLCRITQRQAQHLGMAAAAAGGWIATDPECLDAVEAAVGRAGAGYLALLPAEWREARLSTVSPWLGERIAVEMDAYGTDAAREIAGRVRGHLAEVA